MEYSQTLTRLCFQTSLYDSPYYPNADGRHMSFSGSHTYDFLKTPKRLSCPKMSIFFSDTSSVCSNTSDRSPGFSDMENRSPVANSRFVSSPIIIAVSQCFYCSGSDSTANSFRMIATREHPRLVARSVLPSRITRPRPPSPRPPQLFPCSRSQDAEADKARTSSSLRNTICPSPRSRSRP